MAHNVLHKINFHLSTLGIRIGRRHCWCCLIAVITDTEKYREKDEAGSAAAAEDLARKCVPKMGIEQTNNYIFIKEWSVRRTYIVHGIRTYLFTGHTAQRSDYDARGPDQMKYVCGMNAAEVHLRWFVFVGSRTCHCSTHKMGEWIRQMFGIERW